MLVTQPAPPRRQKERIEEADKIGSSVKERLRGESKKRK
jgi:hypothetical protein